MNPSRFGILYVKSGRDGSLVPIPLRVKVSMLKPTIHETTFVAGDTATLLFVRAAHEISNATFYNLPENRQPVYFQVTCRMYHAIMALSFANLSITRTACN